MFRDATLWYQRFRVLIALNVVHVTGKLLQILSIAQSNYTFLGIAYKQGWLLTVTISAYSTY
jgi:hypothetical protein